MDTMFSLQTILDLARRQSDSAATNLTKLNAEHTRATSTLSMLMKYRDEYQARFRQNAASCMDASALRNFQEFMLKLEEAIEQQRKLVARAAHDRDAGLSEWRARQRQVKAFDTLADRQRAEANRKQVRQEARAADEWTSMHALRLRAIH